jgi:hypothetical protein
MARRRSYVLRSIADESVSGIPVEKTDGIVETLAPEVLHPGDSSIFEVKGERGSAQEPCHIFAPDFDFVPVRQNALFLGGSGRGIKTQSECERAIAPRHAGTKLIACDISVDKGSQSGYRTIVVKEFPFSLTNIATAIGAAVGIISVYLAAIGKKVDKPEIPEVPLRDSAANSPREEREEMKGDSGGD